MDWQGWSERCNQADKASVDQAGKVEMGEGRRARARIQATRSYHAGKHNADDGLHLLPMQLVLAWSHLPTLSHYLAHAPTFTANIPLSWLRRVVKNPHTPRKPGFLDVSCDGRGCCRRYPDLSAPHVVKIPPRPTRACCPISSDGIGVVVPQPLATSPHPTPSDYCQLGAHGSSSAAALVRLRTPAARASALEWHHLLQPYAPALALPCPPPAAMYHTHRILATPVASSRAMSSLLSHAPLPPHQRSTTSTPIRPPRPPSTSASPPPPHPTPCSPFPPYTNRPPIGPAQPSSNACNSGDEIIDEGAVGRGMHGRGEEGGSG